ncbi:50S ribosomal protein L1 [Caldivirga maquilingensis]|uniref:Large ribosomal subunit protein uL1 n=1 Tax=Caldivirga maquilingensis (strain ATCC 700844 / DSM 13496 / JCM 10307 / IC-167) TaxID=397948 RepID=A8MBL2_CALMQ|nr:50S ribosomal protein L1 [Caldivirga maquilingensis]ABW02745.1 ribosomal protein L1 [Caldivirga maquilingensis IC-167]
MSSYVRPIEEAYRNVKSRAKRRRFNQSVDLIIKLRDVDVKKPENRISVTVPLPNPLSKQTKVCVIASGATITAARDAGADLVITRDDLGKYSDKKSVRKLAQQYDFFLATPDLMVQIGRTMGPILGPRGKMPDVIPPNADVKALIDRYRRSVRVRLRDQPQIMVKVGTEDMDPSKIAENALAVLEEVARKYGWDKIKEVELKLTMSPPVKVNITAQ